MSRTRRQFCSAALIGIPAKAGRSITGRIVDTSVEQGHRLRDGARFAAPRETVKIPVVIVGGGISGLSAAWQFDRRGFHDFVLLEMEPEAGGNARWGENEASAYPWAAHYLPVPGKNSKLIRELCEEIGLLDKDGQWAERHLCHSPQERLFLHGRWQEGLEPRIGLTPKEEAEFARLETRMKEMHASGYFTIPSEDGVRRARESERALDRISMQEWLRREGYFSPRLQWLMDYSCRDDYGASSADTSAWAGIHYFASREPDDKGPLTWPEGNGWILKRLLARLGGYVRPNSMVFRIAQQGLGWQVFTETTRYDAGAVVFAAPTFLSAHLVDPPPPKWPLDSSPWLTANLTLDRWPAEKGAEPAWDNVIYDSPTLGYVVATHQTIRMRQVPTVWTFYWALSQGKPADQRRLLLGGDWQYWKEKILTDLERAHPDIRECVRSIDIMRLGHAMVRPSPGAIFHPERIRMAAATGSLVYAHTDLSALSLFEEAQYRGVTAADRVLTLLGSRPRAGK
jgi:phytoene dehydrogenase-like protein